MATVIIHPSQSNSEITKILSSKYKIKVSTDPSILPDYIFSSGVAFVIVDFEKDVMYDGFSSLVHRVVSFGKHFKGAYVIVRVSSETLHLLTRLQTEMAVYRPYIIPCDNNNNQIVDAITTILLTYSKDSSEAVYIRALLEKIEQNPTPPSSILSQGMPFLSPHDCEVLHDALGSLSNISRATGSTILQNTSLSKEDSHKVSNFFAQDTIVFQ